MYYRIGVYVNINVKGTASALMFHLLRDKHVYYYRLCKYIRHSFNII